MNINKPDSIKEFAIVTLFTFIGVLAALAAISMTGWVVMVIVNAVIANGYPAIGGVTFLSLVLSVVIALNSYQT